MQTLGKHSVAPFRCKIVTNPTHLYPTYSVREFKNISPSGGGLLIKMDISLGFKIYFSSDVQYHRYCRVKKNRLYLNFF